MKKLKYFVSIKRGEFMDDDYDDHDYGIEVEIPII